MPRIAGVSSSTTEWRILRNPRPFRVALCLGKRPIELLVWVTRICLVILYYPKISSTVLPRFAATPSGEFIASRALIVARTKLRLLVEPYALANTL